MEGQPGPWNEVLSRRSLNWCLALALLWPACNCLGSARLNTPTQVNVNTYLRSIDKIDDYKMVEYIMIY